MGKTDLHQQMADMIFGYWVSQSVRAFADLSVADHLADGPLTAVEVAAREGSAPETTFRLMRAGITLGLVTVDADQRFHATTLLNTLRSNAPGSLRGMALGLTNDAHWSPWGALVGSVRSGVSQSGKILGMHLFEYLRHHPAQAQEFTAAMEAITSLWALEVAQVLNTDGVELAVDVGGGNGALLRQLQQANAGLRGVVFDRPHVVAGVADTIAGSEFADRTEVVDGDFFEAVPVADLYLLKFILHDWSDAKCVEILSRCREAMLPGGRIAIVEFLLDDLGGHGVMALMDINMLAVAAGQERSLAEFDMLLCQAGLRRIAVRRSRNPQSVIEAVAT